MIFYKRETNYRTKINYVSEKGLFIETGSRIRIVRQAHQCNRSTNWKNRSGHPTCPTCEISSVNSLFTDLNAIFRHNYSPAIVWRQIVIMECRKLQNYIFCFERREKVAEGQQLFRQRIFWRRREGWLIFVQRLENYILQIPFQSMRCL